MWLNSDQWRDDHDSRKNLIFFNFIIQQSRFCCSRKCVYFSSRIPENFLHEKQTFSSPKICGCCCYEGRWKSRGCIISLVLVNKKNPACISAKNIDFFALIYNIQHRVRTGPLLLKSVEDFIFLLSPSNWLLNDVQQFSVRIQLWKFNWMGIADHFKLNFKNAEEISYLLVVTDFQHSCGNAE